MRINTLDSFHVPRTVVGTKPKQQWLKPENIHNKNKSRGFQSRSTMTSGIQVFFSVFPFPPIISEFSFVPFALWFQRPCFNSMPHVLTIPFPKQEG